MKVKKRETGSLPAGIIISAVLSMVMTLGLAGICGILIGNEVLPEASVEYCAMGIVLIASASGAILAMKQIGKRRLPICLLTGAIYWCLLLSTTALFFGGIYQGVWSGGLLILGGCGFVGILSLRGRKHTKGRRK